MNLYDIKIKDGKKIAKSVPVSEVRKITGATLQQVHNAVYAGTAFKRKYYIEVVDTKLSFRTDGELLKNWDTERHNFLRMCGKERNE